MAMFKNEDEIINEKDTVETIIGPSVQVEGDFNAAGDVVIEGTVTGSLKTEKGLKVGSRAKIYANVQAGNAYVAGEIHGNLKVHETLELTESAKIYGDIKTKVIIIAAGASFFGKCSAGEERKKVAQPPKGKFELKTEAVKEEK